MWLQKTTHVPHKTMKPLSNAINQAPKTTNCISFKCVDCPKVLEERYSHSEACCDPSTHEEQQIQDKVALGDAERIREDCLQLAQAFEVTYLVIAQRLSHKVSRYEEEMTN